MQFSAFAELLRRRLCHLGIIRASVVELSRSDKLGLVDGSQELVILWHAIDCADDLTVRDVTT